MSTPAIRALKQTFSARITVLTSSMAAGIVPFISDIDEVMVFDLPWVKAKETIASEEIFTLVQLLKQRNFDAAAIFTVFSQNPLPAAMVAYMASIPLRLAYCRENPYGLLTDWLPDKEPYTFIQHQVERDIALVNSIGASVKDVRFELRVVDMVFKSLQNKLEDAGVDTAKPWLIFHAGVSEKKREYPAERWIEAAKELINKKGFQVLFTGAASEKPLCDELATQTGKNAFSVAGLFPLQEFIALVKEARIIVSVNTGTVHIAAAVNTPVVVLYAQTNPQHTPWMVPNKVLEFEVEKHSRSKNEVIQYMYKEVYNKAALMPGANEVVSAVTQLLEETSYRENDPSHIQAIE